MSTIFDFVASEIDRCTELGRLESRGAVRLALKEAGFSVDAITAREMSVVLERVMPKLLDLQGVANSGSLCETLAASLRDFNEAVETLGSATPESVFARLAGD